MQAIELNAFIDSRHEIHLQLPPEAKEGQARIIVLFEENKQPANQGNLDAFLDALPLNPAGRTPADILAQVQDERDSWGE